MSAARGLAALCTTRSYRDAAVDPDADEGGDIRSIEPPYSRRSEPGAPASGRAEMGR
ncbi:hypothetical protein [Synechococcus sp. RSCCF101]|uniref:hypothetical protein n=1 Tax=Synechococcus sp. RSCCF101 TaxID=2511069 RepID=UPI001784A94C|nr:hypothetical protein [Synechococcus sp. RSCCF101]